MPFAASQGCFPCICISLIYGLLACFPAHNLRLLYLFQGAARGSALPQEASLLCLTSWRCLRGVLDPTSLPLEAAPSLDMLLLFAEGAPDSAAGAALSCCCYPVLELKRSLPWHCYPEPRSGHSLGPSEARKGPEDALWPPQTLAQSPNSPLGLGSQAPVRHISSQHLAMARQHLASSYSA